MLALSHEGFVYTWGEGNSGQLGLGKLMNVVKEPTVIDHFNGKIVTMISASRAQNLAVTRSSSSSFDLFIY